MAQPRSVIERIFDAAAKDGFKSPRLVVAPNPSDKQTYYASVIGVVPTEKGQQTVITYAAAATTTAVLGALLRTLKERSNHPEPDPQ